MVKYGASLVDDDDVDDVAVDVVELVDDDDDDDEGKALQATCSCMTCVMQSDANKYGGWRERAVSRSPD